ncbi:MULTISPECIES: pullulanase-type alpha-1,6-glucosidase [unclassified Pseudoalteromonas]|uniref:pullulanase-type alpha-1,6-glucosidase n=1 Tax=unclassified Pseudoalteromonas TaxID=194690 RepID=UPI000C08BE1D|nr:MULTISPECIES: pullulanase-type alpha-1,6-glucosidase [unclassified Pseudoalteromonas]MDP2634151.1 pullulanase-type alpha-1,6-glucosidase [Pseudoalteromonas sp. 1_MG-2023]PHN90117.1 pullulanase [Pseudoalteromonas sp. 3D05]
MNIITKVTHLLLAVSLTLLFGCGGAGSSDVKAGQTLLTCDVPQVPNAEGTQCVDPEPISCDAPLFPDANNESCINGYNPDLPDPVVFAGEGEAILFYKRPENEGYEGYRLHSWNTDGCDAYAPPFDATDWADGHEYDGVDPNYGAYWIVALKEGYTECANFIVHIGTDGDGKAYGDVDLTMPLMQDDERFVRMNFTFDGEPSVFEFPVASLGERPVAIDGASAHWIDLNTVLYKPSNELTQIIKLHSSVTADLVVDLDTGLNGETVELTATELSDEQAAKVPHLTDWTAYQGSWDADAAKQLIKQQLVVAGYDADGKLLEASFVQSAKALDALYTQGESDANEAMLGVHYNNNAIDVSVWAPTANNMMITVFDADKTQVDSSAMTFDSNTGIWSISLDSKYDRHYFRFAFDVYHPTTKAIESLWSTDPYSLNVSSNGLYSQLINLNDDDTKPQGWDERIVPTITNPEDAVIYEGHVRDFSVRDQSVSEANRGKYLAFTELESVPMQHLKQLADKGLTHFHLLPVTDIGTIEEDASERVEITDTLGKLCERINDEADACKIEDKNSTIVDIMQSYLPGSDDAQALASAMRDLDGFNWGYDPHHFIAPEGSYASSSAGIARVLETRAMVQSLQEVGLRVVLDVVYNHTTSSGVWEKSVFDKLVPGYYHRYNEVSGAIERSTCCENTATEHVMMDKFVTDSMVILARDFGYDSFRFDVMGHMPKSSILAAREAVQAVDPDNYFYGEGWDFGEVANNRLFTQAKQADMAGSEVGTFNDRIREAVRGGAMFSNNPTDGNLAEQDTLRLSLAGNLQNYILKDFKGNSAKGNSFSWNTQPTAYALDPADSINYVSKHDNETLWDQLQYKHASSMSIEQRVRAHNMALSIPLMSQGIPFMQLGADLLRSKSMDRDSYNAGDWFNAVDLTKENNNWNIGLPNAEKNQEKWSEIMPISANADAQAMPQDIAYAGDVFQEFLAIRSASPLFRLTTEQDVIDRVGFHNVGKNQQHGLIVMSLDDGQGLTDLDSNFDAVVVVINATEQALSHTIATATGFELHPTLQNSVDSSMAGVSFSANETDGTFTVPAYTMAVFVKPQGDTQGTGLSANATVGAPDVVPFGSTTVYVRGSLNDWGTADSFEYMGDGEYRVAITLTAGDYEFKIASEDWATVDFGALSDADKEVLENQAESLTRSGANMTFTAAMDATYVFSFDASDKESPTLTVYNEEPFVGTPVFVRGSLNDWGTSDELMYQGKGIYTFTKTLSAGSYEFKIASEDWETVDFGSGESDALVTVAKEKLLAAKGANMMMDIASDGDYQFVFDASNLDEPTLSVFDAKMFGETQVYLRGSLNGWGTDNPLMYQSNAMYSTSLELAAGDYEFKIASEDWSTVDYGGVGEAPVVMVGEQSLLEAVGANIKLTIAEQGNYTFAVIGPDRNNVKVLISKN